MKADDLALRQWAGYRYVKGHKSCDSRGGLDLGKAWLTRLFLIGTSANDAYKPHILERFDVGGHNLARD